MNIKSLSVTASAGFLALSLAATEANAAVVTLADYLVTPNPGDSWTYIYTHGPSTGTEFTVTEPWYVNYTLLPDVAETGVAILVEPPYISIYLDIIPELTVSAGTFYNVLQMAWPDSQFPANTMNTTLGIDPAINAGVTEVNWFALGVGEIKQWGIAAEDGSIDGGYELISYTVSNIPIPAAIWLFGSGLIGLIGVARRKKA